MKETKIYHYHPETGALLGAGLADPDPMVRGGVLIPDFATTQKPPKAKKGHRAVFVNGAWAQRINEPAPAQRKPEPPTVEQLAVQARARRNRLLAASDFTQVTDYFEMCTPDQRTAWRKYRQELRDLTKQAGFPENAAYPEPPQ